MGGCANASARPPSKQPFLKLRVELDVVDLHLSLEGALCDRTVGPTGSAAPEPGFFPIHVELLLLDIFELYSPPCPILLFFPALDFFASRG